MSSTESADYAQKSIATLNAARVGKILAALAIVVMMVSSSFLVLATAETEPAIWPSEEAYAPGETVVIFGEGWREFVPVKIEMSHPDFIETHSYVVIPDLYGNFRCANYTAEGVAQWSVSVKVTAVQVFGDEVKEASTEFYDPAVTFQGYTLKPHLGWTQGDIKGYNEGDSVPYKVVLEKASFGPTVTVRLGFDYHDLNGDTYGIDYLSEYWSDPPTAPFNTYPSSSTPFWVDPSQGTITEQGRLADYYDEGGNQIIQVWYFKLAFAPGATTATVRFGAHMALTSIPAGYYGASYYPGSSLHVRIVALDPPSNQGNRDVPIALGQVMTPPEVNVEKSVDPSIVVKGDVVTYVVHWNNTGQATAHITLDDWLPPEATLIPGSFLVWTSENPTPMPPSPGPTVDGRHITWIIGPWRGTGLDSALPVLEGYLSFKAVVNTNVPGCYWNWVYLNYTDDHGGRYPMVYAGAKFCVLPEPQIDVEKSGELYAHVGDTVTYYYDVTNTGPVALVDVDIVDDVVGIIASDISLAVGETKSFSVPYTIKASDPDHLINTVTATGKDAYGRIVSDSDEWEIDILHPEIVVRKTSDWTCAKIGETVWYTITVANPSTDTDLYDVVVSDPLLGTWSYSTLLAGEWKMVTASLIVSASHDDPLINTVTAKGKDLLGLVVMDDSSWKVDIYHPMISIVKWADLKCAAVGETVTYYIDVKNPSDDTDMYAVVNDPMISASPLFKGWIAPGDVVHLGPYPIIVPPGIEWLENTAHVDAWDKQEHYVSAEASWKVEIVYPEVAITKVGDKGCAAEGETVTYTITVTNTGDITLASGTVTDLDTGYIATFSNLDPGESISWTTSWDMPEGEEFINHVIVNALDLQGHKVSAKAAWYVDIVHPGVKIDKTADKRCAAEKEEVTYTITVTNTGDIALKYGEVYDDVVSFFDVFYNLGPGDSKSWKVTIEMPVQEEDFVNWAKVVAWDLQGHEVSDADSWTVDIVHPQMIVDKTADKKCAAEGEEVEYTITVTNIGDIILAYGEVNDYQTGLSKKFYDLEPGKSVEYKTSKKMPVGEEFVNFVYVDAWDAQDHKITGFDSWTVDIVHPKVQVTKWSDKTCAKEGEEVVYKITVKNTGDITLAYGYVYDRDTGLSEMFTNLEPGEVEEYTTSMEMPVGEVFTNWVYVDAWDLQDHYVYDSDSWTVDIVHPAVKVTKWSELSCAEEGEEVTYVITVENTGDITLASGKVYDPDTGFSATFDNLPAGGSLSWPTSMNMPAGEWFVNTVYVDAYDLQGHYVYDSDSWRIDIVHPAVDVKKTGDKECAAEGEEVTYTITVTNTGDIMLKSGTVSDPATGLLKTFEDLAPGDSVSWTTSCKMPEGEEFVNVVTVIAYDLQGHKRSDSDSWTVDIVHPGVKIDKTADKRCAAEKEEVTYTITVTNTGDITLKYGEVYDDVVSFFDVFYNLGPGDSKSWEVTIEMPVQEEDFVNWAKVVAWDLQGHEVSDADSWTVDIVHPEVSIVKSADKSCAHEGEEISYTLVIENLGDTWLNGTIYDTLKEKPVPFQNLMPGHKLYVDYTITVPAGCEWIINEAWVEAYDHQQHLVSDSSSWTVEILHPAIDVEKVGPESANMGEEITYTVTVTNIGDTPLYDVYVVDSLVGFLKYFEMLDVGDSEVIEYTYTVPYGEGVLVNVATAYGWDRQDVYVEDSDEWQVFKNGRVTAYKYADLDMDGYWEEGEPIIVGWLITLTGPMGTDTRITDPEGRVTFDGLPAGEYELSEAMPLGWKAFTPTSYKFTIGSGTSLSFNFGNMAFGQICVFKFEDKDLDGIWDEDEPGVPDWPMYVYGYDINGEWVYREERTGSDGWYCFTDLLPGEYWVAEGYLTGWYPTTPSEVFVDVSGLEPFEKEVLFGNARTGTITGFKWLDEYMNGVKDGYEPGLEGWTIVLDGWTYAGDHVHMETETGPGGWYIFEGLLPGVYTVTEVLKPGWVNVTPISWTVTIEEGSYVDCAKFGNVECGSIDGWKFIDWDMDGLKDGPEPGIPGWEITLTGWLNDGDWPWSPVGATPVGPITITTDENGYWKFPCLLPGVYTVTEEERENWYHTTDPSKTVWIASGTHVIGVKFGNVPLICIEGYKFNDYDADGIWDEDEPGLPGWTIVLEGVDALGNKVRIEMVTDETGYFATCYRVLPGDYVLYEVKKDGWWVTTKDSYKIVIPPSQGMFCEPHKMTFLFGNFKLGKICGYKYEDMNGNGLLDAGDRPIEGWTVWIELPWGGYGWTTTDENGYYEFDGLAAGWHYVWEIIPSGWVPTSPTGYWAEIKSGFVVELPPFLNVKLGCVYGYKFEDMNSNGVWDEDEPPIEGWTIYMIWDEDDTLFQTKTDEKGYYEFCGLFPDEFYMVWEEQREGWTPTTQTWEIFSMSSGDVHRVHDFGNFENVWVCVFKYEDFASNGVYDGEDIPLGGWRFTVYGPGGPYYLVTNSHGLACLELTQAGQYAVVEEDLEGWCHTTPSTVYVDVVSGMADPSYIEFGNFKCVEVTFFKYEDVNSNGAYDEGTDRPLEGWEIVITVVSPMPASYSIFTGPDGTVTVRYCASVFMWVTEVLPDGWCQLTPATGYYAIGIISGKAINAFTQQEQYLYEFGNFECVELVVFKYWDKCSNGWYDPELGDEPLAGWYIVVWRETETGDWELVAEGFTDDYGLFGVELCRAGVYYIYEEDRSGWSWITPPEGYYVVEVASGMDPVRLEFGNYLHVKVPIFKYEDVNSNGVFDADDVPIEGWYFEMTRAGDPDTVYSGYTDEDGMLVFEVNRSGLYTIVEEDRAGWTHVNPANGMRVVNVVSGTEVPVQEFGNFKDAEIIVCKVDDINANGEPDEGEPLMPGWSFTLWVWDEEAEEWVPVETKETGPCGCAVFVIKAAGLYAVSEDVKEGWTLIWPWWNFYEVEITSGEVEKFFFSNFKLGKIFGWKWNDLDGDGVHDANEPGLPGWTIWFEGTSQWGYLSGWTETDENGYYEFTGLPLGTYRVWELVELGWIATSPQSVGGISIIGHSEVEVDFLNFQLGCLWGYKYEDMDGDGVLDEGDNPLAGWTIYLAITGYTETPEGAISFITIIDSTVTDESGYYEFCMLGPGTYVVMEESRAGWIHTNADEETVVMTSGLVWQVHTFLNFELGSICGYKFEDMNSNGVWDENEPPINGWAIYMIRDDEETVYKTWTDETGRFCFKGLTAEYYVVWEEEREGWCPTTLTGYIVTIRSGTHEELPPFGNFRCVDIPIFKFEDVNGNGVFDAGDRPVEGWQFTVTGPLGPVLVKTDKYGWANVTVCKAGRYTVVEEDREGWMHTTPAELSVDVVSGMRVAPLMFGNFELGEIWGFKFYDRNMNGEWDMGEEALPGWVIWINGTLVGGGYLNLTRITGGGGGWSVFGLPAGTYVVSERLEYAAPGWVPSTSSSVVLTIVSGSAYNVTFGNFVVGDIVGCKFYDKDLDGVRDADEPGLAGWTIILEGYTDYGVYVYREAVTGSDGCYAFTGVQPGSYDVYEDVMAGWQNTTALPVHIDISGSMSYFLAIVDIGNIRFGKIWGYKFLDTYEDKYPFWPNGVFDEDEFGLGNWRITLEGWNELGQYVKRVTYTDDMWNLGYYEFCDLLPGMYWVNETLLWGYYATRPISNLVIIYPHPMGPVVMRIDFGNLIPKPDPEINFVLRAGWNLWSMPIEVKGLTAKGLLQAIGPSGLVVTRVNSAAQKLESYIAGDPDKFDFPIVRGEGYYVYVSSEASFKLRGDLTPMQPYALNPGWNIIGYSQLEPMMASELLKKVGGTYALVIAGLDARTGKMLAYVDGDPAKFDFVITPGHAYYIWVDGPGTIAY